MPKAQYDDTAKVDGEETKMLKAEPYTAMYNLPDGTSISVTRDTQEEADAFVQKLIADKAAQKSA